MSAVCSAVGGSATTPAAARYGTMRAAKSAGSSIRMWSPLIDSAFFWSKRAGLGLTFDDVERGGELVEREDVAVGTDRPAEKREVVEQPLVDEALVALQEQVGLRVALGQLLRAGLAQDERHVAEARHEVGDAGVDERGVERELSCSRGHEVLAADDVGDAHEGVVDGVRERVQRLAARAHDDEVGERAAGEGHLAPDEVDVGEVVLGDAHAPRGLAALRAERGFLLVGEVAVEVVVPELLGAAGRLVARVDLFGRRVGLVDGARLDEPLEHLGVDLATLGLAVGRVRTALLDALVPVDLEPRQRVDELPVALFAVARGIGVLDAEDHLAARVARVRPVVERCADHPDVRESGRRGAEAHAHIGAGGGRGAGIG